MLFTLKKSILLSILLLLFSACAPKSNGKYQTKYSYHPYYSLYAKEMSNQASKIKRTYPKKKKEKLKVSSTSRSRFPSDHPK